MTSTLLLTKLYAPSLRPGHVHRSHLTQRLDQGLAQGHRLTLISAPAGYGKTTLAAEWLSTLDRPIAWLSLDESDNELAVFSSYLVGALETVGADIGRTVRLTLELPETPPPERLAHSLINEIAAARVSFVLVLDDYHLIHASPIHELVRMLLLRGPEQMHLVLATRHDPPLPLSQLRGRGLMTELLLEDLRFSPGDSRRFVRTCMGLDLSDAVLDVLGTRTEGWVAGLQMAALSLRYHDDVEHAVRSLGGDSRTIAGYLLDEVLRGQPPLLQDFMIRTSILERLSAPLCDAVVFDTASPTRGAASSREILQQLDAAHLFIVPLDDKRHWYRYHGMFRDLLRERLAGEPPEAVAALHRRACRWHREAGTPEAALLHALAIPDQGLAADIAEQQLMGFAQDGALRTSLRWIEHLSQGEIYRRPYLCAACGWVKAMDGRVEEAERYLEAGEAALHDGLGIPLVVGQRSIVPAKVRGELIALRARCLVLRGDVKGGMELYDSAMTTLPKGACIAQAAVLIDKATLALNRLSTRGLAEALASEAHRLARAGHSTSLALLALALETQASIGRDEMHHAERLSRQVVELSRQGATQLVPVICRLHLVLAAVHHYRYERPVARAHVLRAQELADIANYHDVSVCSRILLATQSWRDEGSFVRARDLLDRAEALCLDRDVSPVSQDLLIQHRGLYYLARGDLDAAINWHEKHGVREEHLVQENAARGMLGWHWRCNQLARLNLSLGRYDDALAFSSRVLDRLAALGRPTVIPVINHTIMQALAWQGKGDLSRALECLERAFEMAEPGNQRIHFVESGAPMARLLHQAILRGIHPRFARELLALIREEAGNYNGLGARPGDTLPPNGPLPEPLTERERQVLRLLAVDLSSNGIAERLVLSVHTVRSYTKIVYRKLDVHSREEAIAVAEELGLV